MRQTYLVVVAVYVVLLGGCGCGRKPVGQPIKKAGPIVEAPVIKNPGCVRVASLRVMPDDNAEQLSEISPEEPVRVLESKGGWTKVLPAHYDTTGWVRSNAIGEVGRDKWPIARAGAGDFSHEAARYMGTPYKWGGLGLDADGKPGIDCSGLVHMAYRNANGVLIPRDASDLEVYGRRLEWSQLCVGDLITYSERNNPKAGKATHVAIWMGKGKILNARKGVGVVVEQEPDWLRARRRFCFTFPSRDLRIGKGMWVVNDSEKDSDRLLRSDAAQFGLRYIIVKAFDGGMSWSTNASYIESLRSEHSDCRLFLYGRMRGKNPEVEMALAIEVIKKVGVDGFVFDVEDVSSSKNIGAIMRNVRSFRDKYRPGVILAFSTFGLPKRHGYLPYGEMEKYCDIAMPQCYFVSKYLPKRERYPWPYMMMAWDQWQDCSIPVVPTCQVYANVTPQSVADFTALGDKGFGVNYFKWELTGPEQVRAIRGEVPTSLTPAQVLAVQNPTKQSAKSNSKMVSAQRAAKGFTIPKMPLAPTKKGSLNGMVVIIDAGHGGTDPGKPWGEKGQQFTEAGITYQAAWQLAKMIRAKGGWVYLTVYSPGMMVAPGNAQTPPIWPRDAVYLLNGQGVLGGINRPRALYCASVVKSFEAQKERLGWRKIMFVSLHVDSQKKGIKGAHTLYWDYPVVAEAIATELIRAKIAWNAKNTARHQEVTVLTANPLKYQVLVEMGVPANSMKDSWRLRSPRHRERILKAVARGLESANKPN